MPEIVRMDDSTVRVGEDVICFDPDSPAAGSADLVIDPAAFIER